MFSGSESVRIRSALSEDEIEAAVEDALAHLGPVSFRGHGDFSVSGRRFKAFLTEVEMDGRLAKGRKDGEWLLTVDYSVQPSLACWLITVVGFLLCVIGPLI